MRGFSIPELLVAIMLFSIITGVGTDLLMSGLMAQRRSFASQQVADQASFVAEYLSRQLRQARKDLDGLCLSRGSNYEIVEGGNRGNHLKYVSSEGCREVYADSGILNESTDGIITPLTSDDVTVNKITFEISGQGQLDSLQPIVNFALEVEGNGKSPASRPVLRLQTAISQRDYDIEK